jgi:hypothetical protein
VTHRLDLDVSRELVVRGATVAPYVSVVNAYNAKNVFVYLYKYSTEPADAPRHLAVPVLPTAGVRVAFSVRLAFAGATLAATRVRDREGRHPASRAAGRAARRLSASAFSQVVLLERTRNGSVSVFAPPFDLEDALGSDDGIAETGATVTLTTPSGATLVAREDNRSCFNTGTGRLSLLAARLRARARRHVPSVGAHGQGRAASAETVVPGGVAAVVAESRTFDRASDVLCSSGRRVRARAATSCASRRHSVRAPSSPTTRACV